MTDQEITDPLILLSDFEKPTRQQVLDMDYAQIMKLVSSMDKHVRSKGLIDASWRELLFERMCPGWDVYMRNVHPGILSNNDFSLRKIDGWFCFFSRNDSGEWFFEFAVGESQMLYFYEAM